MVGGIGIEPLLDHSCRNRETPSPDCRLNRFKVEAINSLRADQRLNLRAYLRVERVWEPFFLTAEIEAAPGSASFASQIFSFTSSSS